MSAARVFPFKPGDRGAAATEKNLTSILLHASDTSIVGFGREARRRFFEMDPDEQRSYMYLEQFKMVSAPGSRGMAAPAWAPHPAETEPFCCCCGCAGHGPVQAGQGPPL